MSETTTNPATPKTTKAEPEMKLAVKDDIIAALDRATENGIFALTVSNQFNRGSMAYLRHEIQRRDGERIQVACYGRRYFDSAARTFRNEIIIFRL